MTETSSWMVNFGVLLYPLIICSCDCKTTSKGHSIHCFQLVCLVNGCYACCPEMYWHVSTSVDLFYCFLVDAIVNFSTLSNVSRWSFPHFNLLYLSLLSTIKGTLTTVVLS